MWNGPWIVLGARRRREQQSVGREHALLVHRREVTHRVRALEPVEQRVFDGKATSVASIALDWHRLLAFWNLLAIGNLLSPLCEWGPLLLLTVKVLHGTTYAPRTYFSSSVNTVSEVVLVHHQNTIYFDRLSYLRHIRSRMERQSRMPFLVSCRAHCRLNV